MKRATPLLLMALSLLTASSLLPAPAACSAGSLSPEQVLAQSRARYQTLKSYTDTGTVATQYRLGESPAISERHSFATYYQAPRSFLLDFHKDAQAGAERFVIWGDEAAFNTWWSATHVHDTYGHGRGANAFALGSTPSKGAAVLIPPLLFSKAGLQGPLVQFTLSGGGAVEKIGGHDCYRLTGREAVAYGSGNVAGARALTLWIDMQTLLVRQVFEDTPDGSGADTVSTVTTTYEPQGDVTIEPAHLHFEVPAAK